MQQRAARAEVRPDAVLQAGDDDDVELAADERGRRGHEDGLGAALRGQRVFGQFAREHLVDEPRRPARRARARRSASPPRRGRPPHRAPGSPLRRARRCRAPARPTRWRARCRPRATRAPPRSCRRRPRRRAPRRGASRAVPHDGRVPRRSSRSRRARRARRRAVRRPSGCRRRRAPRAAARAGAAAAPTPSSRPSGPVSTSTASSAVSGSRSSTSDAATRSDAAAGASRSAVRAASPAVGTSASASPRSNAGTSAPDRSTTAIDDHGTPSSRWRSRRSAATAWHSAACDGASMPSTAASRSASGPSSSNRLRRRTRPGDACRRAPCRCARSPTARSRGSRGARGARSASSMRRTGAPSSTVPSEPSSSGRPPRKPLLATSGSPNATTATPRAANAPSSARRGLGRLLRVVDDDEPQPRERAEGRGCRGVARAAPHDRRSERAELGRVELRRTQLLLHLGVLREEAGRRDPLGPRRRARRAWRASRGVDAVLDRAHQEVAQLGAEPAQRPHLGRERVGPRRAEAVADAALERARRRSGRARRP